MTRPNFAKLQILYTMGELEKEKKIANSVRIAERTGKTVKNISDDLKNLAKYHYIKKSVSNKDSCCFKYSLLKEGRSVLKKLTHRAIHGIDLRLFMHPFITVNFNKEELDWINNNLKNSGISIEPEEKEQAVIIQNHNPVYPESDNRDTTKSQSPIHPQSTILTHTHASRISTEPVFCAVLRMRAPCPNKNCNHYRECHPRSKQIQATSKSQSCVTLPSDTITPDQGKGQIVEASKNVV